MSLNTSRATKLANKATSAHLSNVIDTTYDLSLSGVEVMHSNEVNPSLRDQIWSLFEENMYEHYKDSSFGWKPASKRKELFNSLSRFLIVRGDDDSDTLLAFLVFRFEHEYDQNMLYCYDVQVASTAQGKGLGKKLFLGLEKLCKEFGMEKITLTVLKCNERASDFYKSLGFTLDPSSPSNHLELEEAEEVDYEILSKVIQTAAA